MKKLSSIFFLFLLSLLHYGKAISYLHCQIENFITTGNTTCDCEKQIADNDDINTTTTAEKISFKEKASESLFDLSAEADRKDCNFKASLDFSPRNNCCIHLGFHPAIFQPPEA